MMLTTRYKDAALVVMLLHPSGSLQERSVQDLSLSGAEEGFYMLA